MEVDSHCPKLYSNQVPLLLYADDATLISQTRIGSICLLIGTVEYLDIKKLQINYSKSKIPVFANKWKAYKWKIKGNVIDQVK